MNLDWFLGFVEGEGCFNITFSVSSTLNVEARAVFTIGVSDKEVLLKIKDYLSKCMIDAKIYQKPSNRRHNFIIEPKKVLPLWDLKVVSIATTNKLAHLLNDGKWHSKKYWSFQQWKKALCLISELHSTNNYVKIAEIAQSLNDGGQGKRKWTSDYIRTHCYDKNNAVKFH